MSYYDSNLLYQFSTNFNYELIKEFDVVDKELVGWCYVIDEVVKEFDDVRQLFLEEGMQS